MDTAIRSVCVRSFRRRPHAFVPTRVITRLPLRNDCERRTSESHAPATFSRFSRPAAQGDARPAAHDDARPAAHDDARPAAHGARARRPQARPISRVLLIGESSGRSRRGARVLRAVRRPPARHPPRARYPSRTDAPAGPTGSSKWSPRSSGRPQRPPPGPRTPSPAGPRAPVCPNLPQRPRSRRSAGRESLIFRASSRRRSRLGAPLWQIWTRPGSGPPQKPHTSHRVGAPQRRTRTRSGDGAPTGHRPSLSGFIGPDTGSDPDSRRAAAGAAFRAVSVEAAQSTMRTASPMYPRAGPGS